MTSYGYPFPGPQTLFIQDVMKAVYFVSDASWQDIVDGKHRYDLVVIGSGFCGLGVVHRALKNNPRTRILMLERGDYFVPGHVEDFGSAYVRDFDGFTKTYPWTLSEATKNGGLGGLNRLHGQVPFFGGKSTLWTAWCPHPARKEMVGWPEETITRAMERFDAADSLLRVQTSTTNNSKLQEKINQRLADVPRPPIDRVEPARISLDASAESNVDYRKFSTPRSLMELVVAQKKNGGAEFHIACSCIVEKIIQQNGTATALQTSRGSIALDGAKLILALGTLPSTTLARNSFPEIAARWPQRFSAHFKSSVTIRIPLFDGAKEAELDAAANHITGWTKSGAQFHIQLAGISDQAPLTGRSKGAVLTYVPTIDQSQLTSSVGYAIFVLAVLGELAHDNPSSWFRENPADPDITTNSTLQLQSNTPKDVETWDTMDEATFDVVELLRNGKVEYWRKKPNGSEYEWTEERPSPAEMRKPWAVHEASTMHIADTDDAPVGTDYKLRGTDNVYVTGGALWPTGGSFNPTLTMVALAMDLADRLVPKMEQGHRG